MTEQFVAALIGAPFGLNGFVKARPLSGEIEHLLKLESVVLRQDGKERTLRIEARTPQPPGLLLKFAGFDSPEAAKALGGAEVLVSREQAAPLRDGEFYVEDLRGLAVTGENGVLLGHITGIVEGGGGEIAEIRLAGGSTDSPAGADGGLKLVPFRKEFFVEISPEKGRAVLGNCWILE